LATAYFLKHSVENCLVWSVASHLRMICIGIEVSEERRCGYYWNTEWDKEIFTARGL